MAITHAMWVHGSSMKIEYPSRLKSTWRAGFYTRAVGKPNTTNWFHFHIPTVVIDDNKRQMLDSVLFRFRSASNATVISAHIYDGETNLLRSDGLSFSNRGWMTRRINIPGKPSIRWGIGISLQVAFNGGTDQQNTIEFSSAGADLNLFHTVRLHFKTLAAPTTFTLNQMLQGMRDVYEPAGIRVVRASDENLNLPALNTVDVGACRMSTLTDEQDTLFDNRNNVGNNDIAVYMVQATNPPLNGCASSPSDRPSVVVASTASRWTLGHEVGHQLGLAHVEEGDFDSLMTQEGTSNITNPPPDLSSSEIRTIKSSRLTQNP